MNRCRWRNVVLGVLAVGAAVMLSVLLAVGAGIGITVFNWDEADRVIDAQLAQMSSTARAEITPEMRARAKVRYRLEREVERDLAELRELDRL